uniref:protein-tyrosine-phosphatase n=1 Tax=Echeneis naucrates TaxID=173247 RepID=A0A665TQH1_ECHNA
YFRVHLGSSTSVVRSHTMSLKRDLGLTTEVGALKENVKKNRYKDILPYDQSRVVLSLTTDSDSDYINASFIKGAAADKKYIASQGPLSSTVVDFWRMIWQHDVKVSHTKKCECYWAPVHQSATFGPFTVHCVRAKRSHIYQMIIKFLLCYANENRSVIQYQFLSWPDHDIPNNTAGVLDLLENIRSSQRAHSSPLLIHCSAGCGRTGVICALDYINDLLVTKQITSDFSIMKIVLELRRQRPSAVQTKVGLEQTNIHPYFPLCRSSKLIDMNDTYAVVNKPKQSHPPSPSPTYSTMAPATSTSAPIYSSVQPRGKPQSILLSATPIYDTATPASHRLGDALLPNNNRDYQLVSGNNQSLSLNLVLHSGLKNSLLPAEGFSKTDDDYEEFSSSVTDVSNICSPGGIGFNCRIQKPRGPRDPPAEWSRLER